MLRDLSFWGSLETSYCATTSARFLSDRDRVARPPRGVTRPPAFFRAA